MERVDWEKLITGAMLLYVVVYDIYSLEQYQARMIGSKIWKG